MPLEAPVISATGFNTKTIPVHRYADKRVMFRYGLKSLSLLTLIACLASAQDTPGPAQPIPFSHKIHVGGVKLICADCHTQPAIFGDPVSIPDAAGCLECHAYSVLLTPTLKQLNAYNEKKQPIPWVRIFRLKQFVFFDHRFHVMNGAQCEQCHGPIGTEDVVSDQLKTTSMGFCQACHVKTRALTGCNTCHDPR